jgi:hypothetical protein
MQTVTRIFNTRYFLYAFLVCAAGQMADVATTIWGLELGAAESNPLMDTVIQNTGYIGFILVKLSGALLFARMTCFSRWVPWVYTLPFFYFAWHNLQIISALR